MTSSGGLSSGRHSFDEALNVFAAQVGTVQPVCVRGGGTRWGVGGEVQQNTHELRAPSGIVAFEPAEMTVRVRAGTPVAELHEALAEAGQRTSLPERPGGTVGGAVMVGESGICRLGLGPVRDALLQARYVTAEGRLATAGAGTVKNVSGFDLCRLLVGSLGTLGLLGEALLRTAPMGELQRWVRLEEADPSEVLASCRTALSILWNGKTLWTLLGGYGVDVDDDLARLRKLAPVAPSDVDGPPELPPCRWSCTPAEAVSFRENADMGPNVGALVQADDGRGDSAAKAVAAAVNAADAVVGSTVAGHCFVAEIGVGVVHTNRPQPTRDVPAGIVELNSRIKERFDPTGRLNPGRDPLKRS